MSASVPRSGSSTRSSRHSIPADVLQRAVSGVVTSVLSELELAGPGSTSGQTDGSDAQPTDGSRRNQRQLELESSSEDDFERPVMPSKKKRCVYTIL